MKDGLRVIVEAEIPDPASLCQVFDGAPEVRSYEVSPEASLLAANRAEEQIIKAFAAEAKQDDGFSSLDQ